VDRLRRFNAQPGHKSWQKGIDKMSILQDYEAIRKQIGEKEYNDICAFLEAHKHYYLSDVYYRKSVWLEFKKWQAGR